MLLVCFFVLDLELWILNFPEGALPMRKRWRLRSWEVAKMRKRKKIGLAWFDFGVLCRVPGFGRFLLRYEQDCPENPDDPD